MIELSESLKEKMFGDDAILRYIDDVRIAFDSGDRSALLFVVFLCARFQAVIPEWATDALLKAEAELEAGKVEDPNVVFGWPKIRKGQREKAARQKTLLPKCWGICKIIGSLVAGLMLTLISKGLQTSWKSQGGMLRISTNSTGNLLKTYQGVTRMVESMHLATEQLRCHGEAVGQHSIMVMQI